MADDIDDLLRRAMKTLDDQVPSGYFEALSDRTLARLEGNVSMQPTGTAETDRDASTGIPPMTKEARDEDSGLHDIRSLASSTKARMSARRSTANPVMSEDDVLASSSAGWKAVALPEPAKMVSLPELAELPSAKEVKEKDKAARKAKAAEEKAAAKAAPVAADVATAPVAAAATATAKDVAPAVTSIGSRIAAKKSGGNGKTIALVGMGLAAAAGVTLFFVMNKNKEADNAAKSAPVAAATQSDYKPTAKMLPPPPPPAPAADTTAAAGSAAPAPEVQQIAAPEAPEAAKAPATKNAEKPGKVHKVEVRDTSMTDKAEKDKAAPKAETKAGDKAAAKGEGEGEPSFDALLKEAGVSDQKKAAKPTLDKKSLSGADIKTGMGSVAGKAQACFAGTQGTAAVKLTVAPSGQVSKVTVTGVFAGTPVASCVEAAVKSASFPPWDGGPQSFAYSYLLAE